MENTGNIIEVRGLTKYYGDKLGVENVSFTIRKGEIVGLLGPNGAGKSTIMKMMTGYLMPTSGSITIDEVDAIERPREAAAKIGFMPEIPPLYTDMTVTDYLSFVCDIKGVKKAGRAAHMAEVMALTAVTDVRERLIRNLSKGYRQRVGFAEALIGMPEILILDEPTVGLDPKQITEVRGLLTELAKTHTIILSSHILSEINMVCEKLIILSRGRIVAEDTTERIETRGVNGDKFTLRLKAEARAALAAVRGVPGVTAAELMDGALLPEGICLLTVTGEGDDVREALFFALAGAGMPILELASARKTLEQAFLDITGGAAGKEGNT